MQQNMNNLASSSGNMSIGGGIDGNFYNNNNNNNNNSNINNNNKCICKSKVNKIPRPRNAFILFRQKYHQMVLDEGTVIRTNPEVSEWVDDGEDYHLKKRNIGIILLKKKRRIMPKISWV